MTRREHAIRIPIGIERVLCRAAGDPAFREALLADRLAAVDAAGWSLAASEAEVLRTVPAPVLRGMIDRIDLGRHARKRFMQGVVAVAFSTAAAASIASAGIGCGGIEPDEPGIDAAVADPGPGDTTVVDVEETISRGIVPDEP